MYLQVTPKTPTLKLSEIEVASAHWVPIRYFLDHIEKQNEISFSRRFFSSRKGLEPVSHDLLLTAYPAARHWPASIRKSLQRLCGSMYFWSIELPIGESTAEGEKDARTAKRSSSEMRQSADYVTSRKDDIDEEPITLVMESSDDDVIEMSDDDNVYLSSSRSERDGGRIARDPFQKTTDPQRVATRAPHSNATGDADEKFSVPPARLTLWGLTLSVTSELMDMMHEPSNVPRLPLRGSHPVFDWSEVNFSRVIYHSQDVDPPA